MDELKENKVLKVLGVINRILVRLLVIFSIITMVITVVTVLTVDKKDRSIFGFRFYVVESDSMSLSENNKDMDVHFDKGDIVIVRNVKVGTPLEPGDIISFYSLNADTYSKTVTHMIREVKWADDGSVKGYVTFGTNTGSNDGVMVDPVYVYGRYVGMLPDVGDFFTDMKTTKGYIIFVLIPFLILIAYYTVNLVQTLRKYHGQQIETELRDERSRLEAERAETQRMMQELMALKAQLEQKNGEEATVNEATPEETAASEEKSAE